MLFYGNVPYVRKPRTRPGGNMSKTKELIDAAKAAQGITSDYRLARVLGTTDHTVANWRHGRSRPDDTWVMRLCEMSGMDAGVFLACMNAERAKDDTLRTAWLNIAARLERLPATAIALLLALFVSFGGGPDAGAMAAHMSASTNAASPASSMQTGSLYIMLTNARRKRV